MNDGVSIRFVAMIRGVLGRIVWALPQFVQDIIQRVTDYRLARITYMPSGRTLYRWARGNDFPLDMEDIPDMAGEQDD
jgi:hypothetical protein